jgi:hypothetical protein
LDAFSNCCKIREASIIVLAIECKLLQAFLPIEIGDLVGAWFITPWWPVAQGAGRDEWRPYRMMWWPVAGEKIIITPWWPVAQGAGRDESRQGAGRDEWRPYGMMWWPVAGEKSSLRPYEGEPKSFPHCQLRV